jgi:FKBP-type peptidyl-prolyl cis-trans isomerase
MSNSNRKKAKLAIVFVSTIGLVGGVNADSITDQVEAAKRQSLKQSEENQARLAKEDAAAWAKKKAVMDEEAKAAIEKHELCLKLSRRKLRILRTRSNLIEHVP